MTKEKILKRKIGEVYIPELKKSYSVFQTAWKKNSKDGTEYWEEQEQIFVNEIEKKETTEIQKKPILKATL